MIKFPIQVPTYTVATKEWSKREFTTRSEFSSFVDSMWKLPGHYKLNHTQIWIAPRLNWQTTGVYCPYPDYSFDYEDWWIAEKQKLLNGIIVIGEDTHFVTGDYYFYLNYCPIVDKLRNQEYHADLWDSDYHFYLYCLRAELADKNVAIVKARQKGMEQPNSELVHTPTGFVPMGSLQIGDLVSTPDGSSTPITEIFEHPNKDVYELELIDGRKVKAGAEHLWKVFDKFGQKYKILQTKDLIEKGFYKITGQKQKSYRFYLDDIEPIPYQEQDLPIDPYILGCLLGDGTIKGQLKISSQDEFILNKFREKLPDYHLVYDKDSNCNWRIVYKDCLDKDTQDQYEVAHGGIRVSPIIEELKLLGLRGTKATTKFIPDIYIKSSVEQRVALLQGMMDADGHITSEGGMEFKNCAPQLIEDFITITRSLGIKTKVSKFSQPNSNHSDYYRVYLKTTKFNLFQLPRKRDKFLPNKQIYPRTPIVGITKLDYKEDSRCISVDTPDHLYITKDFIPTHNTLKFVSMLIKDLWFTKQSVSKIVAYDEDYINDKGAWKFASGYRSHLIEHTEWSRSFDPSEVMHWEQKKTVTEGLTETRTSQKGLRSKLIAQTTKANPAKAVSGHITKLFCEEAGIAPNLDKVIEYAEAATKLSSVKTGMIYVSGAVGELKDCKPLEDIALNPEDKGFLGVEDTFSEVPNGLICFFVPDTWNYIGVDDQNNFIKCYDEHGNTDLELAEYHFSLEEAKNKKKGPDKYRIWKSQHPRTLKDAFGIREDNPFAVDMIKEHQTVLHQRYKPMTVKLKEEDGVVKHYFSEEAPIRSLRVNPDKDNSGAIEIYELPPSNIPWGMFYAGIDPIAAKNTSTSHSLMSITIYKAIHYVGERIVMDYPVASYTGRHAKWEHTYETCLLLMKFYNARTAVENNIPDFIEWCIKRGESRRLLRRKEIHMVNEFVPQSTIRDEIGIRMEGELKKKALNFLATYIEDVIGTEFDDEGIPYTIYGVTRIKDPMLLEELLNYTPKLNTDRLIAFALALMAARSNTNRNIIVEDTSQRKQLQRSKITSPTQVSQFTKVSSQFKKLPSPFSRR